MTRSTKGMKSLTNWVLLMDYYAPRNKTLDMNSNPLAAYMQVSRKYRQLEAACEHYSRGRLE